MLYVRQTNNSIHRTMLFIMLVLLFIVSSRLCYLLAIFQFTQSIKQQIFTILFEVVYEYYKVRKQDSQLQKQFITNRNYRKQRIKKMFCDNASCQTLMKDVDCFIYPWQNQRGKQMSSYNYLPAGESRTYAPNLYQSRMSQRQSQLLNKQRYGINQQETMELLNQNTRIQNKESQAVQRNKYISTIISILLAFSQRIQELKVKISGYPAQFFSPIQFFNVLDLSQKGYVDMYDVKRFINNQKIRQKDVICLFKKVNGGHDKDNTRLNYFGYLNLIKPYFNQQLARDLLRRDSVTGKERVINQNVPSSQQIDNRLIEPIQQSVLLLFQELILLHCICSAQHQQAKQLLMSKYMLNTMQIRQIIGLGGLDSENGRFDNCHPALTVEEEGKQSMAPLQTYLSFIQNNSHYVIQFQDMKYLLSFLNAHEYSLMDDRYLALLFLPTNCKAQIMRQINRNRQFIQEDQGNSKYMSAYLSKQNLMNKGNIQMVREYLDDKTENNISTQPTRSMRQSFGASQTNFLQFVHPRSLQRAQRNEKFVQPQSDRSPVVGNQHPSLLFNASNKYVSQQKKIFVTGKQNLQRQMSNSSDILHQNVRGNAPKSTLSRNDSQTYGLKGQFYQQGDRKEQSQGNISSIPRTPFLQRFMRQAKVIKNVSKYNKSGQNRRVGDVSQCTLREPCFNSYKAFQVIEQAQVRKRHIKNYRAHQQPDVQKFNIQPMDCRYNLVISQYKSSNNEHEQKAMPKQRISNKNGNNTQRVYLNPSYSKDYNYPHSKNHRYNSGLKHQKQNKPQLCNQSPIVNYSNSKFISDIGMSQSSVGNNGSQNYANLIPVRNILDDFLKK